MTRLRRDNCSQLDFFAASPENLRLAGRATRGLQRHGLLTAHDIDRMTVGELRSLKGVGKASLAVLASALASQARQEGGAA